MREYHAFRSMQPMLTIQRSASSSFTTGRSIHCSLRGESRVVTSVWKVGIQSGMWLGAFFWKNALPRKPSG